MPPSFIPPHADPYGHATIHLGEAPPASLEALRAVIRPILAHKLLFCAVALGITALGSGVVLRLPKAYTATASVALQAPPSDPLAASSTATPLPDGAIDTELDLLKSPETARQVVTTLGIGAGEPHPRPLGATTDGFLRRLSVVNTGHSQVIGLSYTDADPARAAAALNLMISLTAKEELKRQAQDLQRTTQWLASRAAELGATATRAEQAEQQFRASAGLNTRMVDNTPTPLITDEITSAATALMEAQNDLAAAQAQGIADPVAAAPDGASSAASGELADLESRREEAMEVYGPRHPTVAALNRQIALARHHVGETSVHRAGSTHARIDALNGKVARLAANLAALRAQGDSAEAPLAQLRELQRASDSANAIYQNFVDRTSQIADRQSLLQPNIAVVAPAEAPDTPSFPNTHRLLAACALLGLVAGAGAAFLRATFKARRVTVSAWAGGQTDLPLLAKVPEVPMHRRLANPVGQLVARDPQSEEAASMRGLLDRLIAASKDGRIGSVVVTSATVEEGKSTVCLWLAQTVAATGRRVLLIDGDQRHGSLCRTLGVESETGLSDWLMGTTNGIALPAVLPMDGYKFMPPGAPLGRAFTEEETQRLTRLMPRLHRDYHLVIIDAAPVLAMAEAEIYARVATHTVLVCHAGRTTPAAVRNCATRLREAGATLTGLVLSMVNDDVPHRYGAGVSPRDVKLLQRYYA